MKMCFVSFVTEDFIPGMKIFLKSLITHNKLEIPYLIFVEKNFKKENKESLLKIYKNIEFKYFDKLKYKKNLRFSYNWSLTPACRFEIFLLSEYDKVIYLDTDMLCRGDISLLFNCNHDFCAVINQKMTEADEKILNFNGGFNAGLMVIGKKYLTEENYNEAISLLTKFKWHGNQGVFNKIFKNKTYKLPEEYLETTENLNLNTLKTAKIIHFVGKKKPWFSNDQLLKNNFDPYILNNKNHAPQNKFLTLKKLIEEYKKYV